MNRVWLYILALGISLGLSPAQATYAISMDQLDAQKVFWGGPTEFENPAEVKYEELIKSTPEYKQIRKDKIARGTGRYWILMSNASERSIKAIGKLAEESDYDLIAASGYLGSLKPAVPAVDVTDKVIKVITENLEG